MISFVQGYWEIHYVNIIMYTTRDIVIQRLQKSQEVMLPLIFAMPLHTTIQMAAMFSVIAHHASNMHHTRTISGYQGKKNVRIHFMLQCCIPDLQPFLLETDQVLKTRE